MDDFEVAPLDVDLPEDERMKCSGLVSSSRRKTPVVSLPKYQYNRDELLSLKEGRCARLKPNKLPREFELEDGHWDPDKWFYNGVHSNEMQGQFSRSDIPSSDQVVQGYGREEQFADVKHSGADFKRSLAHGFELEPKIVLVPQRNSFNTGCNALRSGKQRDTSPQHRDGRERSLRIGSGRMQVGDKRSGKLESDGNERRGGGGGNYEHSRKDDRFRRGDKRETNLHEWNKRDRSSKGLRRSDGRIVSGSRSQTHAVSRTVTSTEPEWFTRGPSSRADIIELHGFRMPADDVQADPEKVDVLGMNVSGSGDALENKNEMEMIAKDHSLETKEKNSANKESERESKELMSKSTVESKSELANASADLSKGECDRHTSIDSSDIVGRLEDQESYFSELFKDNSVLNFIEPGSVTEGSSRFQAFFDLQPQTLKSNKTELSLLERFPYLSDGLDRPLPASPPIFGHELSAAAATDAEEQKRFLMMLEKANLLPTEDVHVANKTQFSEEEKKDVTENLKKLLNLPSSTESNEYGSLQKCSKVLSSGSKALLAEEVEAQLLTNTVGGEKRKIVGQNLDPSARPISGGSKVTMVADLEDSLMANSSSQKTTPSDPDGQDLAAFNRLLQLVQGPGRQPAGQNEGKTTVAFTGGNISATRSIRSSEQMMSNSYEGLSGCPALALSLMGNQRRIANCPVTSIASSPVLFGSQPPTNPMVPSGLRLMPNQQPPATAHGQDTGPTVPQSLPQETLSVTLSDHSAAGVESLLINSVMNVGKQEIISPSHPSFKEHGTSVVENNISSNDRGGKTQDSETVSAAFLPMAVMRKIVTDRLAGRNSGDKASVFISHSTAGVAENAAQYSCNISTGGSIRPVNSGSVGESAPGISGCHNPVVSNVQQGPSWQQNQILEAVKDRMAGATAVQQPQRVVPPESPSARINFPAAVGGLLSKQNPAQGVSDRVILNDWAPNEPNRNAAHIMAQLQGQMAALGRNSALVQHQSTQNAFPSQLKLHPFKPVRPVNADSWPPPHFQVTSGHLPGGHVDSNRNYPVCKVTSSAPVGRPIVKGNQQTNLSAAQSVTQQIPLLQQQQQQLQHQQLLHQQLLHQQLLHQQQHLPGLHYSDSFGGPGNVFLPGADNRWLQFHSGNSVANSLQYNGRGFELPSASSSICNTSNNSVSLSRLFGENLLQHSSAPSASTFHGHKTTMLTVGDLERRLALGESTSQLL